MGTTRIHLPTSHSVSPKQRPFGVAPSVNKLHGRWVLNPQNELRQVFDLTAPARPVRTLPKRPVISDKPGWSAAETGFRTRFGHGLLNLVGQGNPAMAHLAEVEEINALESTTSSLSDEQLRAKTDEFKARLTGGESLHEIRPEAFAVAREACARVVKMRPRDVQILAGISLDEGQVAQMATGEGKTLAAVAPAYLNALKGKGVHVVTVNDTLATRDAAKMGPVYEFLGLSVDVTNSKKNVADKRQAYLADITYGSNDVFGFDYLSDLKAKHPDQRIDAREPYFALVDEVDQVLIDEANTPLIIASPGDEPSVDYRIFSNLVKSMRPLHDIRVDQDSHSVFLTESGMDYVNNELSLHESLKALKAAGPDAEASRYAMEWGRAAMESRQLIRKASEVELKIDKMDRQHPGFFGRMFQHVRSWLGLEVEYDPLQMRAMKGELKSLAAQREELMKPYPDYNLWAPAHMHRVGYLQSALEAQALFYRDEDYAVIPGPLDRLQERAGIDEAGLFQMAAEGVRVVVGGDTAPVYEAPSKEILIPAGLVEEDPPGAETIAELRQAFTQAQQANPGQQAPPEMKNLGLEVWRRIARDQRGQPLAEREIKLIDEFKGRIGEGRRLTLGLHQALEAKEGLKIRPENRTLASVQYPRFFSRYPKFAGMTGTALSAKDEFKEAFGLDVSVIPRHLPLRRDDLDDLTFRHRDARDRAAVAEAIEKFEEGVPVLLVTPKVEHNQEVSDLLTQAGIPHQVLNTKSVKNSTSEELSIVSRSGRSGSVLVATNMAGRGQDFKHDKINYKKLSIHLERLTRSGEAVSVRITKPSEAERLIEWLDLGQEQGHNIPWSYQKREPGSVQLLVGGEGPCDIEARQEFAGEGVAVIALGRNGARRIDDQVVGRTGRQGGPGESRFWNSLEDDTVVRHTDKKRLTDLKGRLQDRDPALTRVVEKAQFINEQVRLSARIDLQKYDGVLEPARKAFYKYRDQLVDSRPWEKSDSPLKLDQEFMKWASDSVSELALRELLATPSQPVHTISEDQVKAVLRADLPLEPARATEVLQRAGRSLGLELSVSPTQAVRPSDLIDIAGEGVEKVLDFARSDLSDAEVDQALQSGMLRGLDLGWASFLEAGELLKQSLQFQTLAEKDPFQEFKLRIHDTYVASVREMRAEGTRQTMRELIARAQAKVDQNRGETERPLSRG